MKNKNFVLKNYEKKIEKMENKIKKLKIEKRMINKNKKKCVNEKREKKEGGKMRKRAVMMSVCTWEVGRPWLCSETTVASQYSFPNTLSLSLPFFSFSNSSSRASVFSVFFREFLCLCQPT